MSRTALDLPLPPAYSSMKSLSLEDLLGWRSLARVLDSI